MSMEAWMRDLQSRVERLESASPLERAAVYNGQVRFITSTLRMESGSTLILSGTLTGDGTLTWTGAWTLAGDGTISGPVDITGAVTITGPLDIEGQTTITGDTTVDGDMTINAGRLIVAGSNQIVLEQNGGTAHMLLGASEIRGGDSGILLNPGAGPAIVTSSAGLRIFPLPTIESAAVDLPSGALWADSFGFVYRVV